MFGWICLLAVVLNTVGCQSSRTVNGSPIKDIRISAITEFVPDPAVADRMQIKVLVELLDKNGISIKAPCRLRFEFYEFHPLSSDPRGQRLLIWPNQDLNDSDMNDKHWEKFLRGYEFLLPLNTVLQSGNKYVLEVTCLSGQERYRDLLKIEYPQSGYLLLEAESEYSWEKMTFYD